MELAALVISLNKPLNSIPERKETLSKLANESPRLSISLSVHLSFHDFSDCFRCYVEGKHLMILIANDLMLEL